MPRGTNITVLLRIATETYLPPDRTKTGTVFVYDLRDGFNGSDCCVLSITNPHKNEKTGKMGGGVTRLKFSADGKTLFSSARKSNSILCWDLRANVTESMFTNIQRPNVRSNAKTKFDIEPCGKHLVSGWR